LSDSHMSADQTIRNTPDFILPDDENFDPMKSLEKVRKASCDESVDGVMNFDQAQENPKPVDKAEEGGLPKLTQVNFTSPLYVAL